MVKMPHWPVPLGQKPIDLGLERIKSLLDRLGNPEKTLPPVVHVAGTNGKGSTIAFIRAILEAAGYRVHVYTSPHLVEFNERIILAGKKITDQFLEEVLDQCRESAEGLKITFFEGTTAAAFLAFSKVPADILLLETGLGGRLDATNVLEKPAITIITPISIDHSEFLGDTLEEIAGEKAAIMKEGVPCVVSTQKPNVAKIIENEAKKKKSSLYRYKHEWDCIKTEKGMRFIWGDEVIDLSSPALTGVHQIVNAGTALACVKLLKEFDINKNAIEKGITNVSWPGRLQLLDKKNPLQKSLPSGSEIWIDGGHNLGAAEVLLEKLEEWQDKPLFLIVGMMKRKDSERFVSILSKKADYCVGVDIPDEDDARDGKEIKDFAIKAGMEAGTAKNIEDALKEISTVTEKSCRVLICGSLYLIGSVLASNAFRY